LLKFDGEGRLPMNISKTRDGRSIQAVILDMDGVLWRDSEPIGDLPAIFSSLVRKGWKVALATNNATRAPEQFVEKLRQFGVEVEPRFVINSAQAAAEYLKKYYPGGGPVYVIGEEGLFASLAECGFFLDERKPLAVVVALNRSLTYDHLRIANHLIQKGVPFIGANPDRTLPTPDGPIPGSGAILAALEASSGVKPTIVGKPHPEMYEAVLSRLGVLPENALVVGDRIETDIAGGIAAGCLTGLVLSGVTSEQSARTSPHKPDFIARDLAELIEKLA
jgi:4-nitrophenyl phosphatase